MLQRAAAHRPPALPNQLRLRALHARPGTRGARLVPSGRGRRHRTRHAISAAMLATLQPLQPLSFVPTGSNHHSFPVLGRGTPTLPAPLALLGTPLRLLHPAPRGSDSAPPRAAPVGALKQPRPPPPVHQGAHLRTTGSGRRRPGVWEMPGLHTLTEIISLAGPVCHLETSGNITTY